MAAAPGTQPVKAGICRSPRSPFRSPPTISSFCVLVWCTPCRGPPLGCPRHCQAVERRANTLQNAVEVHLPPTHRKSSEANFELYADTICAAVLREPRKPVDVTLLVHEKWAYRKISFGRTSSRH